MITYARKALMGLILLTRKLLEMAGELGFEPRFSESEPESQTAFIIEIIDEFESLGTG